MKLMNEYSAEWPLWMPDGPADEDELPLSPGLASELRAWADFFNDHFHWDGGWDDPALAPGHATEAVRLSMALQDELGPGYEVVLDLWEAPLP